jgi:hypothetical protein
VELSKQKWVFTNTTLQKYNNTESRKFISVLRRLDLRPWQLKIVRTSNYVKEIGRSINLLAQKWYQTPRQLTNDSSGIYPAPQTKIGYLWRKNQAFDQLYQIRFQDPETKKICKIAGIPGWHIQCATIIGNLIKQKAFCKKNFSKVSLKLGIGPTKRSASTNSSLSFNLNIFKKNTISKYIK